MLGRCGGDQQRHRWPQCDAHGGPVGAPQRGGPGHACPGGVLGERPRQQCRRVCGGGLPPERWLGALVRRAESVARRNRGDQSQYRHQWQPTGGGHRGPGGGESGEQQPHRRQALQLPRQRHQYLLNRHPIAIEHCKQRRPQFQPAVCGRQFPRTAQNPPQRHRPQRRLADRGCGEWYPDRHRRWGCQHDQRIGQLQPQQQRPIELQPGRQPALGASDCGRADRQQRRRRPGLRPHQRPAAPQRTGEQPAEQLWQ